MKGTMNETDGVALYILRCTDGGKRIATARDTVLHAYPTQSLRWWLEQFAAKNRILVDGNLPGEPVAARVECGRWLAECPLCHEYIDVDPAEPVWTCVTCGGMQLRARWSRVIFPQDRTEIESILLERKLIRTRNWRPGESADDLRAENLIFKVV